MHENGNHGIDSTSGGLTVNDQHANREKSPLRMSQTAREESDKSATEGNEDAEMAEDGEVEPEGGMVAAPPEGLIAEEDEKEEGEEEEEAKEGDTMDMS